MTQAVEIESRCHACAMRARAEQNPRSFMARLWRWHTRFCPGWKAYVREMRSKGLEVPKV